MTVQEEKTGCEAFQVALEKEAGGVLSGHERDELAEHVGGCPECQRIRQLIESLRSMPLPAPSSGAMAVVRAQTARRRRRLWRTGTYLAAVCVSQFVFFGPKLGVFMVALSIGAMAVELVMRRKFAKRVAEQAQGKGNLFETLRDELSKQIEMLERKFLWVIVVVVLGSSAQTLWQGHTTSGWYGIGLGVFMAVSLAYAHRAVLPRLRRELAELSAGG